MFQQTNILLVETFVIKFVQNSLFQDEIYVLEQKKATSIKDKLSALNLYLEDGIVRVDGHLSQSELTYAAKHPIVLARHCVTHLLIHEIHLCCLHGEMRLTLNTRFDKMNIGFSTHAPWSNLSFENVWHVRERAQRLLHNWWSIYS